MLVSLTQNWLGALYKGLKVRLQFATWPRQQNFCMISWFEHSDLRLWALWHGAVVTQEIQKQKFEKYLSLEMHWIEIANWWRTLSPLYKAPNQFWVSDTNISGFVRCSDFQPSPTFSDFLWKVPSYGPLKKTAPSQRGSFSRPTT